MHRRPDTDRRLSNNEMLVTVGYSELPRTAVAEFVPNEELRNVLPPDFHYLVDPQFLLQHLYFTAPLETAEHRKLVSHESGRSLEKVLGGVFVPLAGKFMGANIDLKGAFRSGALYEREDLQELATPSSKLPPLGFLDDKHMFSVRQVSNQLLQSGFRSSAFLGGAILKKKAVLDWMFDQNFSNRIFARAEQDINSIQGDLAVYWRLGGVSLRWERLVHGVDSFLSSRAEDSILAKHYIYNTLARTARLFIEEWSAFPDQAKSYLRHPEDAAATAQTLADIALRKDITRNQLELLKSYYAGMMTDNVKALIQLFRNGTDIYRLGSVDRPSDIDLSLFVYDLELTRTQKYRDSKEPIIEIKEIDRNTALSYRASQAEVVDAFFNRNASLLGVNDEQNTFTVAKESENRIKNLYS